MSEVRVARIISRLNIGGPAIQAITLTKLLEPRGYDTLLLRGTERDHEGSMDDLASALSVRPVRIPRMYREVGPADVAALADIASHLRRFKPHVVHTHAAKAGLLGRLAALSPGVGSPRLVHTFHGHSLRGYWSGPKESMFLRLERALARRTDRLVAVAPQVRDELLEMDVGRPESFDVIPVGFDLDPFTADERRGDARAAIRAEWRVPAAATLVTLIARLVPIKRVDRFLRIATRLAARSDVWFAIVGDGELGAELRGSPEAAVLGERLVWPGFRRDIADVCFASDVVALTSDNEGTPVSLIEAQAAGVPVIATSVGGTPMVVARNQLAPPENEELLAKRLLGVIDDADLAKRWSREGRERVLKTFSLEVLVENIDQLYTELLA